MSLSEVFIKQMVDLLGEDAEAFFAALAESVPVSIRLNPDKVNPTEISIASTPYAEAVPWSSFGYYLAERPSFTFDPLLHAGCYYVQEASSMFVEQALRRALELLDPEQETGVNMLDLCAAPGGKSTLALSVLPEGSLLVANELIRTRANILAENLIKWGDPNVVVTQSDPTAFAGLTGLFDIILTDVPCSGEGMFRKDSNAIDEWSINNVALCASRQKDILTNCWPALRPGGFLIYSTCTYNTTEDESTIQWLCDNFGARVVDIPLQENWGIAGATKGYDGLSVCHFFPHRTKGEGFFLTLLQKPDDAPFSIQCLATGRNGKKRMSGKPSKRDQPVPATVRQLLKFPDRFDFSFDRMGRIRAFDKCHLACLQQLETCLRIVHAGVTVGEIKGKDLLPDPSLALSTALEETSVNCFELSKDQAISFLRRESLILPETCQRGWVLMTFQHHPLGWMKNIGARANNAWPNEWRIRT